MANIEALKKLVTRIPGMVWLAVGGLLVGAFWLQQHDARIRRQVQLKQLQNQTSAEVAALRKQAARDVRQANVKNAKAIAKLEQCRQQVEQQNRQLAAQLSGLRKQAQVQAGEVATLPISEIVTRVAAQLGLKAGDVAGNEKAASRQGGKARNKLQVVNYELQKPAAEAAQTAGMAKSASVAPADGKRKGHKGESLRGVNPELNTVILRSAQGDKRRAQDDGAVVLPLTSSGARKVERALVELDACRAESKVETRQTSTCQARAEADEAEVKRLQASVAGLNQAIDAKDKILNLQAGECKAELRAARGTFLGRLARVTEHVAVGLAVGVAIGVAVK